MKVVRNNRSVSWSLYQAVLRSRWIEFGGFGFVHFQCARFLICNIQAGRPH